MPAFRPEMAKPPPGAASPRTKPIPSNRPRSTADQSATVREIVASGALVGRRVRVAGRCLGYSTPRAVGGPPRTRSDWQLEDDGVAIYVTGPLPVGCSPTEGARETTTILAIVAEDTLSARRERPATARRYLVTVLSTQGGVP